MTEFLFILVVLSTILVLVAVIILLMRARIRDNWRKEFEEELRDLSDLKDEGGEEGLPND